MKFAPYFKAIVAALIAGASAAIPQIDDGLSASEGLGVAVAFLTALSVVFAVPNKDPNAEHQNESVQPPQPILGKAILGKAFKGDGGQASLAAATGLFLLAVAALAVVYFVTRDLSAPQAILGKAILGKA